MNNEPLVSVLIPVFNGEKYVGDSIKSIVEQTYQNLEILVLDDGSTDSTLAILRSFEDERIQVIVHEINQGLIVTRNELVEKSKGKYIAFLDSDDISYTNRIQFQVDFLERNSDFGMIGSNVDVIFEESSIVSKSIVYSSAPEEIKVILLFKNYFTCSAVLVRKSVLDQNPFTNEFPVAEDYNVWIKVAEKHKVWNLQETLVAYRDHALNISKSKSKLMEDVDYLQLRRQLAKFKINFENQEIELFYCMGKFDYPEYYSKFFGFNLDFVNRSFEKLILSNSQHGIVDSVELNKFLQQFWSKLFVSLTSFNPALLRSIKKSVFFKSLSFNQKLKFVIKCLISFNLK